VVPQGSTKINLIRLALTEKLCGSSPLASEDAVHHAWILFADFSQNINIHEINTDICVKIL
jgi:hypothetical protein